MNIWEALDATPPEAREDPEGEGGQPQPQLNLNFHAEDRQLQVMSVQDKFCVLLFSVNIYGV